EVPARARRRSRARPTRERPRWLPHLVGRNDAPEPTRAAPPRGGRDSRGGGRAGSSADPVDRERLRAADDLGLAERAPLEQAVGALEGREARLAADHPDAALRALERALDHARELRAARPPIVDDLGPGPVGG